MKLIEQALKGFNGDLLILWFLYLNDIIATNSHQAFSILKYQGVALVIVAAVYVPSLSYLPYLYYVLLLIFFGHYEGLFA